MPSASLTHEQKVEKLLAASILIQTQVFNLMMLETNAPPEIVDKMIAFVADSNKMVNEIVKGTPDADLTVVA